ncbi:hypothetical protein N3K66_008349 [Trichothecium roseum]|uniref:Uncharacterized protein n=1 Tax=Trichothecium roseum TaxID=47278 RepID=A0ACC0USG6_9HYPO|nr:hypothetical protein N3K66_008349 [Trichothecium roseum]
MEPRYKEMDPNGDMLLTVSRPDVWFPPCGALQPWPNKLPHRQCYDATFEEEALHQAMRRTRMGICPREILSPDLECRLSSKHMMLVSKYFRRLIEGGWVKSQRSKAEASKETPSRDDYKYVTSAKNWNTEALLTVLKLIHGKSKTVPLSIDTQTFTQIAQIVDYYQIHEVVDFSAAAWARELDQNPVGYPHYGRRVLFRLSTAWVFSHGPAFTAMTLKILEQSRGPLPAIELPGIPQVTGKSTCQCDAL